MASPCVKGSTSYSETEPQCATAQQWLSHHTAGHTPQGPRHQARHLPNGPTHSCKSTTCPPTPPDLRPGHSGPSIAKDETRTEPTRTHL